MVDKQENLIEGGYALVVTLGANVPVKVLSFSVVHNRVYVDVPGSDEACITHAGDCLPLTEKEYFRELLRFKRRDLQ